jgi:bifunctional ADP-heptose synthase (sugar kinase/adenylyltransferase)
MARILVLGDHLLDHYKFYKSIRNDPATPDVPVVKLANEVKVDGGAGNLVRNLRVLANVDVIHFHGSVPIKIRNYMNDKYTFREDINDEILHSGPLIDEFVDEIKDNDYVVISDYHKGTIKYSDIKRILAKCNETNITFVDTNHVQPEHEGVDWLKINYETARESVNIFGKNRELEVAKKVSDQTGTNVIVTKGADGFIAYLIKSKENIYYTKDEYKNGTKHFVDSIGAGDTFFAGFISALINKKEVIPSLIYADVVAHLSTTQLGTIKVIDKSEADTEYKHIETTTKENGNDIYVNRIVNNVP